MAKTKKKTRFVFIVILLLVVLGDYLVLEQINVLRTEVRTLRLQFEIQSQKQPITAKNSSKTPTPKKPQEKKTNAITIPTAIIFETKSSPLLLPQAPLTVTVEKVEKTKDGTITVDFKVFSDKAEGYVALSPRNLFEIINFSGPNQFPLQIDGVFSSISPQKTIPGKAIFKIEPDTKSVIIQIGRVEEAKFYKFDFEKQEYKETIVG